MSFGVKFRNYMPIDTRNELCITFQKQCQDESQEYPGCCNPDACKQNSCVTKFA